MTLHELVDSQAPFRVPVVVSQHMAGMKVAVWNREQLFVSPAMLSLLNDPDSCESTAKAIKVAVIPKFDMMIPMTTKPF